MWSKIVRDVGLVMLRAGTKDALKKLDDAIAEKPERVVVDVLCKSCGRTKKDGEGAYCSGCGASYGGTP